ncbi:hypothetical protein Tco_0116420 [Tanacetum coccineum]
MDARLQRSASNARFILIIGWDAFGLPSKQYAIEPFVETEGCFRIVALWLATVEEGKGREEITIRSDTRIHGRMEMKGAWFPEGMQLWHVDEEE